jgi:hypothetical protein
MSRDLPCSGVSRIEAMQLARALQLAYGGLERWLVVLVSSV